MIMEVDYKRGTDGGGGLGRYITLRLDDEFNRFTSATNSQQAASSVNELRAYMFIELITSTANSSTVYVDNVILTDLSQSLNM